MANEPVDPTPPREAFFGDLHVHTAYSLDSHNLGAVNTPNEAYEFAKGAPKLVYKRRTRGQAHCSARLHGSH